MKQKYDKTGEKIKNRYYYIHKKGTKFSLQTYTMIFDHPPYSQKIQLQAYH